MTSDSDKFLLVQVQAVTLYDLVDRGLLFQQCLVDIGKDCCCESLRMTIFVEATSSEVRQSVAALHSFAC